MKVTELRNLTAGELEAKERELADQLFALRLQKTTGQLENPAKMRLVRRDLARVLTVAREMRNEGSAEQGR
jgi:large subunit ribosomal protein L29